MELFYNTQNMKIYTSLAGLLIGFMFGDKIEERLFNGIVLSLLFFIFLAAILD